MKIKIFILFSAFVLSVCFFSLSFAEVIYLKNGKVIKAKIVERGEYHIVTEENGIPRRYYDAQIDRIEEDAMDTSGIDFEQFRNIGMPVEKAKLIVTLMNVSGVRANMQTSIDDVIDRVPEGERAHYRDIFNMEEIIERLIPIYDRHYSTVELQGVIAFYGSPAGQKVIEATPEIMKESVGVLVTYIKEKVER